MRPEKIEDEISELARALPRVKLAQTDRLRRELLEALPEQSRKKPASWWPYALAAGIAAAAIWLGRAPAIEEEEAPRSHAAIAVVRHAILEQRFVAKGEEVVELRDGRVRFDVTKLHAGERFVVRAGDGEVEVRGTSFDVDVSQGILREVVVHEGVVAVRRGGVETLVGKGERWPVEEVAKEIPSAPVEKPKRKSAPPAKKIAAPAETEFGAGWDALRRGDDRAAETAFDRADDGPLAEDSAFWRIVALVRRGETDAAVAAMAAFLERFPDSPRRGEAGVIVGWHLVDGGRSVDAEPYFRLGLPDPRPEVRESAQHGLEVTRPDISATPRQHPR